MHAVSICPRCFVNVEASSSCPGCELEFERRGSLLDVLGASRREERAGEVEEFYTKSPFPGYAPADDAGTILDRSRRSGFLSSLDLSIGPEARVLDCGCGTGQLAAFLALSGPHRTVFGVDGCLASLTCAEEFRERTQTNNLQFVRADLFDLPIAPGSFQTVVCRGVVHHTPDPDGAIESVARCVAPGGVLLLGFYETMGRAFHCVRRRLSRVTRRPIRALDPILRRPDIDAEKKRIWIEDQYLHPLEHILPMPRVLAVLERLGFEWVRSVPPVPQPPSSAPDRMFEATARPGPLGRTLLRTGWMFAGLNDPDAGLVCLVARRSEGTQAASPSGSRS